MNSSGSAVPLVVFIENTSHEYVHRLNPQTIQEELDKLTEQGHFEKLDIDLPVLRYRNLKPKDIPGEGKDDESFLLVIDQSNDLKIYKVI